MAFTQIGGVPQFISGDRVVQFYHADDMRQHPQSFDLPTTAAYMSGKDQFKHIGELGFFGQRTTAPKPFTIDILENRQVMETNHTGTFLYDVPFYSNEQCITKRDTSHQTKPGYDEGTFTIFLSEEFKPYDVLTTDVYYGQQIVVTEHPVKQRGDSFEHVVTLNTKNKRESYIPSNLREGITYFKLFNLIGAERDTFLSGVRVPNKASKLTCEFRLGVGSGVELDVSAVANIGSEGQIGSTFKEGFIEELKMDFNQFTKNWGDVAVVMDRDPMTGMALEETARLSDVAEWLVKREHMSMIDDRAMFARAGRITTTSGYMDIAEGLWYQMRRGKIIPYARKGGITTSHFKEAAEYVFQGNEIDPIYRKLRMKAGKYAYENVQELYSTQFSDQLGRLSNITNLFGTDAQIPQSPISGGNQELTLGVVKVKEVYLPGIGHVTVEYDPALDHLGRTSDRLAGGMHPQGKSHGAYAMVIWDARDQKYSNNRYTPKGTQFVEGAPEASSVYLVKKPGELIISGRTNGYYDPYQATNILSSGNKQRFVDYWSWDTGAAYFLADPSSFVMLELREQDRRGFN